MTELDPHLFEDGSKRWYLDNGELHRLDGPSYIHPDGYQSWMKFGVFHRLDGPAILWVGDKNNPAISEWIIEGNNITRDVMVWIQENDLPKWQDWDDEIKVLFRLRFS